MPKKSSLREVLDLSALSEEDKAKLLVNETKAKRGFGLSAISIKDSVDSRTNQEIKSSEAASESEEVQPSEPSLSSPETEDEEIDEPQVEDSDEAVDMSALQSIVQQAIEQNLAPLQEQVNSTQSELTAEKTRSEKLEAELEAARKQVAEATKANQAVENLSRLLGKPAKAETPMDVPNFNKTSPNADRLSGRLAEFMQERDSSGVYFRQSNKGNYIPSYDTSRVDAYVVENGLHNKASRGYRELMNEMTEWGKKHGLFTGNKLISQGEMRAATTGANIPGGFLEVLSSIMRVSARPGLVFWQFPKTIHRYDRGYGEVIDIPRSAYPDVATDSTDRLLSGSGTYVPIDNSNTNVRTGIVQMQLQEYGRGRPGAPPIAIPRFVSEFSMISLMNILQRDLFYDYYNFEDLIVREQWRPTSATLYSTGTGTNTTLVANAAAVAAGGTMTKDLLRSLFLDMSSNKVVPLPDGNYGIVMSYRSFKQLKDSYDQYWETNTPEQIRALTNMMMTDYPAGENIEVSGYQGLHENIHVWVTNAFSDGAVDSVEVFSETDGQSGTTTFRTSYLFGGDTIGRGIGGAGAQILYDEKTDFGRVDRAIWHCYEAHAPLDVDPTGYNDTSNVPQELRVKKVRTSDVVVTA